MLNQTHVVFFSKNYHLMILFSSSGYKNCAISYRWISHNDFLWYRCANLRLLREGIRSNIWWLAKNISAISSRYLVMYICLDFLNVSSSADRFILTRAGIFSSLLASILKPINSCKRVIILMSSWAYSRWNSFLSRVSLIYGRLCFKIIR